MDTGTVSGAGVFDESAPAGRRWCKSPDHHEWLHMLLDRARKDLADAYAAMAANTERAARHACPECGMRRDCRLEPADGGKFGRPGVPLRKRWSCIAGHVQIEDE